jgi:4-hydroxybenzoate polyprenyltransferase
MPARFPKLLAYAQLVRLPNVFTAFADICLAGCITGTIWKEPLAFGILLLSSGCFYLSGMVWNDIFDREEDSRTQPFRPIPSERVKLRSAVLLAVLLSSSGLSTSWLLSWLYGTYTGVIGVLLILAVILYDKWLKHIAVGPIAMGSCRFFNVLLGLSISTDWLTSMVGLHVAAVVGLYIVGVTWFARTEETQSSTKVLKYAAGVMLIAGLAVLLIPVQIPEWPVWQGVPYALFFAGVFVGAGVLPAIANPSPKNVQNAVKRGIFGLVFLDAVLASVFIGPLGLLIALLLIPAVLIGKRVYST